MRRLLALGVLLATPAAAQDWGGDEDWIGGGDDFADVKEPDAADLKADTSRWSLTGFARTEQALWTRRLADRPWAKGRQSLDLSLDYGGESLRLKLSGHGEWDAAYLVDRDAVDAAQLEVYELRYLDGEQYIAQTAGEFEVVFGRQIVAWGEGDALSPLDVVNPRDSREPGLADLDDLRLAVLATRIGWFRGAHRIELMAVHESYFGEQPSPLSDYSPFRSILQRDDIPAPIAALLADHTYRFTHDPERFDAKAQQWLGRWVYKGPGLDLGLYAASVLDRQGVVTLPETAKLLAPGVDVDIELRHARYTVLGLSGATNTGAWLIKWEVAGELDKTFNTGDPDAPFNPASPPTLGAAEGSLVTGMLGVTYAGVTDLNVAFEVQQGVFLDEPADVLFPADAPIFALRGQYLLLNQRLTLTGGATALGATAEYGGLVRAEASYELADGWKGGGGYIWYYTGDEAEFGPFTTFTEHDRLFFKLRYDFRLL
ncbi:MAG: DUF1302 family protein [bacterium]